MKRGIALLLALVLMLSMLPATALATGGVFDEANDGSEERPFQIADAEDLIAFAEMVNDKDQDQGNACAELLGNIDMRGKNWTSISGYGGTFNGNNFTITIDITADESYEDAVALFGFVQRGTVKNLNVAGKLTVTADYAYDMYFSPLVGTLGYRGSIENCSSSVEINVDFSTSFGAGGIVGYVSDEAEISGCSNWGAITAAGAEEQIGVGGIVGWADGSVTMENCYNRATITSKGEAEAYTGGLIGYAGADAKLVGCYSSATADDSDYVNPSWAKRTGIITYENGTVGDLIGCAYGLDSDTARCMAVSEAMIGGESSLGHQDCFRRAQDFDTAEQAKDFLNGDSGSAYVLSDQLGDGWPVLAWELEKPISQDTEQGKAMAAVKKSFAATQKAALDALDNGKTIDGTKYVGYNTYTYRQNNDYTSDYQNEYYHYSQENWELLTAYYNTAKKELSVGFVEPEDWESMEPEAITADGERQVARLTETADTALKDMAGVFTIRGQKEFNGKKLTAQQNYYTTYKKQFYALDTDRGMLSAVWHELTGVEAASEKLEALAGTLKETLDNGLEAMEAARTEKQLEAAKTEWNEKLLAVRAGYEVPTFDTGVADKWDGTTKTQPAGSGTKADPYRIGTGAELAWFAEKVNSGSTTACAVLTADIDLNRQEWTAIATDKYNGYLGTFDGKGHIIHGLWSTEDGQSVQGLFGYVDRKSGSNPGYGIVRDVKVAGRIRAVQSNGSGMVAGVSAGEIYNCEVSGFLGTWKGIASVGGIVGDLTGGSVENCRSYGLYLATNDSQYSGNMVNSVGGIAGSAGVSDPADGGLIRYCENHMRLHGYELSYLGGKASATGGIVGLVNGTAKVRESVNYAEVWGYLGVGGIVGNVNAKGKLDMCYVTNYGDVYGSDGNSDVRGTGGLIGIAYEGCALSLQYGYNAGTIYSEKGRNKYNSAYDYSTTAGSTGGIIGNWRAGDVKHVQSSSENTLWGYAAAAGADSTDAIRTDKITPEVNAGGGMWKKLTATRTLLGKLINIGYSRDEEYKVYGNQSQLYNDTVMQCVRKVELCTTAEEIENALREAETTLAAVPTELEAAKIALRQEMQAFVDGNLYDAENQKTIDAILAEADGALEAAKKLADVTDIRQTYLGSENKDGKLKEVATYPVKAANALYNEFIYGKNYSQEDAATLLRTYESWKLKLSGAATVEEVEGLYAEARKALTEMVKGFTEGETAPDLDQAARDALALARQEILDQLAALEKKYGDALTEQAGDLTALAEKWQTAIGSLLDESKTALHTAATPALDKITDYARLETLRQGAVEEMDSLYAAARQKLAGYLASAGNTNVWDGETKSQPEGQGTEDEPYRIGTGAELAWLADQVNSGSSNSLHAILTADIDLGYCEWTPIGRKVGYSNGAYRGTFDGRGHTVSGLYISQADTGYVGLFGLGFGGTKLKNLTVRGEIDLQDVKADIAVGGIIADSTQAVFENCVSDVQIRVTYNGLSGRNSSLGGFAGVASSGTFTDCRFTGSITCLYNYSSYLGFSGGGLGGLVGYLKNGKLERCVNSGDVTANKASGVGGIAGSIYAYNSDETVLRQCLNTGHISNDVNFVIGAGEWPTGGIGGIAGVVQSGLITIDSCYNTGTISGGIIVGGILGGENGKYGKTASTGNKLLTVKNCYNAGVLDTGTKIDHIGTLVGFPIEGQYRDNLYVLAGTARSAMGWKSSQGDRVYAVDTLTADIFDGLTESIAGLNGGYPIFPWQLLLPDSRETVVNYLNNYYQTKIRPLISDEQRTDLEAMLAQTAETVRATDNTNELVKAYQDALAAMDPGKLLGEACAAALEKLTAAYEAAKTAYPAIEAGLTERYEADRVTIARSANAAQAEAVIDSFAANVVDLLVADAQGAPIKELAAKAQDVESAYAALNQAQQALVQNYAKLADIQALAESYNKNLALLAQWNGDDKTSYPDLAAALETLAADAQTALGECTKQEELAPVLDQYCADAVRLLLKDVGFTAGTTTMGELADAGEKLTRTRQALNGLTQAQKALLDESDEASLAEAETLLAVYNKAIETLTGWTQEDAEKYPQIAETLQALSAENTEELRTCTDRDGAVLALNRYCAKVAGALVDVMHFAPGKTTVAEVDESAVKTARTAYNGLTDEQKALMPEKALETLEAAEKLLAEYSKAAETLREENSKAQAAYPGLAERIGALAAQCETELGHCTSAEEAQKVLDRYSAQVVDLLIEQIGTLPQKPTKESLAALGETLRRAQEQYDALTNAQKQYVTRLEELKAAQEYYRTAEIDRPTPPQPDKPEPAEPTEPAVPTEPTTPAEPVVPTGSAGTQTDSEAVKAVSDLIRSIGKVTLESKDTIQAALDAFNALTEAQKALLPAEDQATLEAAVTAYRALLDQETEQKPSDQPGDQQPGDESKGFDWTTVWMIVGILAAAAVIFGLIKWFLAAKRGKEK